MTTIRWRPISKRLQTNVVAGALCALYCLTLAPPLLAQRAPAGSWVGTWATAAQTPPVPGAQAAANPAAQNATPAPAQGAAPQGPPPVVSLKDQTLRQIVRVSLGGERMRVVFSNVFGTAPLEVGAAHVAKWEKGAAIVRETGRTLTFSGRPTTTIAAGAVAVSDPVDLTVATFADLAIDLYVPGEVGGPTSPLTTHQVASQTNYLSPAGNHAGVADMPVARTSLSSFFLARVEVMAPSQTPVIVTLGDSITDGTRSTPDTNNRWPDHFARRLKAQNMTAAVLNVGISGNQVIGEGTGVNALARLDRDVLLQPGVTHVVVLEGINDVRRGLGNPSAADIIAGHRQIIERARARGLTVYGATLTPFEPSVWTPENEAERQGINEWIRTSKMYDAVIDFDAATKDPQNPTKLLPAYDSGDHIHPNDAGYKAMADAVSLELFKPRPVLTRTAR